VDGSASHVSRERRAGSRVLLLVILGFPAILFALAGLRAAQLAREGEVPEALRDLDCDGTVTFAEWLRGGIDYRLRASASAPGCSEIYAAKTGRALVLRCPEEPRCRLVREVAPAAALPGRQPRRP
jgi:hypothetical protein